MKKLANVFVYLALICLFVGIGCLTKLPAYLDIKGGKTVNFNEAAAHSFKKGDVVEGTIDYALGAIAEEYETNFGIRTSDNSTKLYYVLWMDNDNFVIYETASSAEYDILDKISDETYTYLESAANYGQSGSIDDLEPPISTLQLEGTVKKMTSEVETIFKEWYDESFDDGAFDTYCEPLMISHMEFDNLGLFVFLGIGAIVLAILFGVIALIIWRKEKNAMYGY